MLSRPKLVILASFVISVAQSVSIAQTTSPQETPQVTVEAAQHLIQTGHADQALPKLDALVAQAPSTPGLQRTRGTALYTLGKLQEAVDAFALATKADPHDTEAAQMQGLILFRLGKPAAAIPLLEMSQEAGNITKADPRYVLALSYMDTRRYDDARHAFGSQYGFQPDSAAAYLVTARMLFRREFVPVAQQFANKAAEIDPQLPLVNELLGEIALSANHLDEAASFFEKERSRNPLEPSVYDRLGDTYTRATRYADARRVLQQAILLEPNSTGPYILLGKVTLKENDPIAALTYLQRAERMDPSNFMTHNLLAQTYRALSRPADAARELQLTEQMQNKDAANPATTQ